MQLRKLFLALIVSGLTTLSPAALACVDTTAYKLSSDINSSPPDFPLNQFVDGHLGILSPKFGVSYLLTAYRYLSDEVLYPDERDNLLKFWNWYFLSFNTYPVFANDIALTDILARYSMSAKPANSWDQPIIIDERLRDNSKPLSNVELQQKLTTAFQDYIAWRKLRLQVLQQKDNAQPLDVSTAKNSREVVDKVYQYYTNQAQTEDQLNLDNVVLADGMNLIKFATLRLQKLSEQVSDKKILATWIKTQQAIFQHLDTIAATPYVGIDAAPANDVSKITAAINEFPAQLPTLAQAEKAYFQALANFYTRDTKLINQSADQFTALANNKNYPWHDWMIYLANRARALAVFVDQAQQLKNLKLANTDQNNFINIFAFTANQQKTLQQARQDMLQLAATTKNTDIKQAAEQYAGIIANRIIPDVLAEKIYFASKNILFSWIKDYLFTYDLGASLATITQANTNYSEYDENQAKVSALPDAIQKIVSNTSNDFSVSNWINLYQISANKNYDRSKVFYYAYRLWQANPDNQAWLLVATNTLAYATPEQRNAIIQVISKMLPKNAAYSGYLALHAALLLQDDALHILSPDQRKELIDVSLKNVADNEDFRSKIFFLNERIGLTSDLNDLLLHASYTPSARLLALYPAYVSNQPPLYYLATYSDALQQVPLATLLNAAHSSLLSETTKTNLLANIWVRAILLKNKNIEQQVATELMSRVADLAPYIKARNAAVDADEKATQFVSALLHLPYLSPQVDLTLSDTWNADTASPINMLSTLPLMLRAQPINQHDNYLWNQFKIKPALAFLNAAEKNNYQQEIKQLSQLAGGTDWVTNEVINLAKRHPHDERYAELLALSIKATHYANGYTPASGLSKRAFMTLKQLYPNSEWAKKTKYYY
jgi:hypothetical protein